MLTGGLGGMALTGPITHLLHPEQRPAPYFRGCVAGAAICAGLSLFPVPWLVAGFVAPRATATLSTEIFDQIRALAMAS